MKAILEPIIAFGVVVSMIIGGITYLAKASDLKMVEMRLDQKIVSDQVQQMQTRVWLLEDRNKGKPCSDWQSEDEKTEYRKLKEQLRLLEHKQMEMMKK
jgi:hypothetical protein